jgi:hypothetical protein
MELLSEHKKTATLPKDLVKISDLLEYEGPILSHFQVAPFISDADHNAQDYLFYWVDYDQNVNRWLVWDITPKKLAKYLKGLVSLKDLLVKSNNNTCFIVDIDAQCQYKNIIAVTLNHIPTTYIPESDSFYTFDIPQAYQTLIATHKSSAKTYAESFSAVKMYAFNEPVTPFGQIKDPSV